MKTRVPQLLLEESLFSERSHLISIHNVAPEEHSLRTLQPTYVNAAMMGDKSERTERLTEFFALSRSQQAVELANALLRQFAFRTYKTSAPDIIPAFNNAFPRTAHSLTRKSLVLALLDEMGLTEDTETEHSSSTCNPSRRMTSVETSTVPEWEREDTVLERLLRHVLRQFHAQHPCWCHSVKPDSSTTTSCSTERSRNSRTVYLREWRKDRKNCDFASSELSPTAHVVLPVEEKELDASALRNFFRDHPTEDEQVFIIANELLQQHIRTPHRMPVETPLSGDVLSEREFGSSSECMTLANMSRVDSLDVSMCENRKEDGVKLPRERLVLIELLKSLHEASISPRVLPAIFEQTVAWSSSGAMRERTLDMMLSNPTSTQSSGTSLEALSRQIGSNTTAGGEIQDSQEFCGREKRRRLPSLLSLYLQSHLEEKSPSMENVNKRMLRMRRDSPKLVSASVSFRETPSACVFSPVMSSDAYCNIRSVTHYKFSSPSKIVSVRSMEGMTRIGRGSSGELFAMRRVDTGELVAVKRIYITDLSREYVENELSVLRRSIGLSDDAGVGINRKNSDGAESVKPPCSQETRDTEKEDDGNSEANDCRGVIRCYDAFFDGGSAFIVMELMDSGSLMDALNARLGRPFSEEECRAIAFQVLHGLRYLHENIRQLHRDLKPHNILLDKQKGAVKLTDFGLCSEQLQSMGFNQCGTYVGTLAYMSPNRVDPASVYGKESDFWSLGITLIQLARGKLPFFPNVFVIAGFATHPPRLTTAFTSGEGKDGTHHGEKDTDFISSSTPFSEAFEDFIAVLLPASRERKHVIPLVPAEEENNDSTQSCTYAFSVHGGDASSCSPADVEDGVDEGDETTENFGGGVGHCSIAPFTKWILSRSSTPDSHRDTMQELPSPALPGPRGMPQVKGNGNDHVNAIRQDDATTEEGLLTGELTSTALLQHPWLRGMTWEKSRAIIAAVSLEP
ncbi:protein kinase, putative [Trypanosoma cruzi marinkellei]|uniref:mitogen-activated protein kinase kinase n=1 Tax=Trypanosoma cruzi marinkellei TaxID=85056 RepID=K2NLG0_TRYCR|nr:protein kinase, putative [Trypanosoma cruzi marinkellei]